MKHDINKETVLIPAIIAEDAIFKALNIHPAYKDLTAGEKYYHTQYLIEPICTIGTQ